MGVSRALNCDDSQAGDVVVQMWIDAVNCPKQVIDKHLCNSGIDYADYHRDA